MMRFTQSRITDTVCETQPASRAVSLNAIKLSTCLALLATWCLSTDALALSSPITAIPLPAITISAVTPQISENIKDIGNLKVERSQTQTLKLPANTNSGYISGPTPALNASVSKNDVIAYIVSDPTKVQAANSSASTLPADATPILVPNGGSVVSWQKNIGDAVLAGQILASFSNLNYTDNPLTVSYTTSGSYDIQVPFFGGGSSGYLSGPYVATNTKLNSGEVVGYIVTVANEVLGENATLPACYDKSTNTSTAPCTFNPVAQITMPQAGTVLYIKKSPGAQLNAGDPIGSYSIDGKAAPGVDFVPVSGLVTIPAGQSTATFELIPQEDNDPTDGNEDVTLTISANSAYAVGTPGSAVITLVDGPFMTVSATDPIAEIISGQSPDPGAFTFSRTGDTGSALTFDISLSGTAINGTDYATLPTQVTIPAGQSSATLTVTPAAGSGNQSVKTVTVDSITLPLAAPGNTPSPAYLSGPLIKPSSVGKPIAYLVTSDTEVVAANGCLCDLPADAVPVALPQFGSGSTGQVTGISFTKNVGDAVTSGDTIANLTVSQWATVAIAEGFISPSVDVVANQGGSNQRYITVGGGNVTVTADVTDLNPGETHTYDWSATDNALTPVSGTTNSTFVFDPSGLSPGFYTLRVTVTDSSLKSTAGKVLIDVVTTLPDLDKDTALDNAATHAEDAVDDVEDSDGDGTPDASEGYTDTNNNGIPDYLDSSKLGNNEIPEVPLTSDQFLIVTEPDYAVRLGDVAFAAGNAGAQISLDDIAQFGGPGATAGINTTDTLTAVTPYVDFTITGLFEEGDTAKVVVAQQDAVPANAHYRVYHPSTGWQDFVVDANNSLASCCTQESLKQNNAGNKGNYPGSNGNCPAPGSSDYQAGLAEGATCVELTIQDGGPNDTDGVADHVITDPSVVAYDPSVAAAGTSSKTSSGGGAVALPSLLALIGFYFATALRRRARVV